MKSALPIHLRNLIYPLVPKFLKKRASVIKPAPSTRNPFDEETIYRWFSSTTQMDSQLQAIHAHLKPGTFAKPSFRDISQQLFGVDSIYHHYMPPQTQHEGAYATHIQQSTLDRVVSLLGENPHLGIEVGSYVGHGACN